MAGFSDLSAWTGLSVTGLNSLSGGQTWVSAEITPPTTPSRPFYLDVRIRLNAFTPTILALPFHILPKVDDQVHKAADITSGTFERHIILTDGYSVKHCYLQRVSCPIVPFGIAINNPPGNASLSGGGNSVSYITYTEG